MGARAANENMTTGSRVVVLAAVRRAADYRHASNGRHGGGGEYRDRRIVTIIHIGARLVYSTEKNRRPRRHSGRPRYLVVPTKRPLIIRK